MTAAVSVGRSAAGEWPVSGTTTAIVPSASATASCSWVVQASSQGP